MGSRQKKILAAAGAVILILALGLAGTFAASSSTDSDSGFGDDVTTSLFLHDDFSTTWTGDVRDRDVYVENNGDTSLYVRMRLDEFMRYGGKSIVSGGKEADKSTWKPHIPAGAGTEDCGTEIHDYFTIQMGNDTEVKYKPGTKNAYYPAVTEAEKTAAAPAAETVLIEDYLNAETKPAACWIIDTADGYAYWHTQLKKDQATGLILNSITDTGMVDESYYYGINAIAEAVTESDLYAWLNGNTIKDPVTGELFDAASQNAVRLLKNMSPKYIEITEEMEANGASDYDSDNDGYLTKRENTEYEAEKGVTSTPAPDPEPDVTVSIDAGNFPDSALLTAVRNKDTNSDGKLSKEERNQVTSLDLSGTGITDYTGLEHFTALSDLNVSNNGLTELNFLSKTPKLTTLNVSSNHLKSLDVSSVPKLRSLTADNQTVSTALIYNEETNTYNSAASAYKNGTSFSGEDVKLQGDGSIRVSNMAENKTNAYSCPVRVNGGSTSVSGAVTLTTDTSGWTVLDSTTFPAGAFLTAARSKDLNEDNKLSEEEVYKVTSLDLSGKGITNFKGLEAFTKLETLDVSNSSLTTVNFLSRTPNLTSLNVSNNELTSLSLAKGALTTILEAVAEEREVTRLTYVNCSNNHLTSLDLGSAPGLETLNCKNNNLTKLDISGNASLRSIVADNQAAAVNVVFDKTSWKYKGGNSLFTAGTTFGAEDAAYDSSTGGLVLETLTDGKTSTYSLPLQYSGSQRGTLSGTVILTGTIYVSTLKEKVAHTPTGGTVTLANKDGSMTEWIVYNKTESEADLITKGSIAKRAYHASSPYPGWPNSDIRKWLNDGTSGYKSQLSDEMKTAIKAQRLTTAKAFDNWTTIESSTDEIYLLTETGLNSGKVGKTIGASVTLTREQLKSTGYWWLRSPRLGSSFACLVSENNTVSYNDVRDAGMNVKPAVTISTEPGIRAAIDSITFPDDNLRTVVRTKDTNSDGKLSEAEINAAASLDLSGKEITDYTGLELLTSLTNLNVSNSNLTEINFLDKTPELTKLNVSGNHLKSLDVSNVPKLTSLTADNQTVSTALTYSEATNTYNSPASAYKSGTTFTGTDVILQGDGSIRVSNMTENKTNAYSYPVTVNGSSIRVSGTVTLTTDISGWKALNRTTFPAEAFLNVAKTKDLNADNKLSEEEVNKVTSLDLSGKGITNFTGIEVFTKLEVLDVSNSSLTTVNFLSKTPNLTSLDVSNNELTSLRLVKGLLTTILEAVTEERAATQLTYVNCSNNNLTNLDLSSSPGLETLNCRNNELTKLDISGNASLKNIVADSQATTVNVVFDKTIWKYKGGSSLFAAGTTFGAGDALYDSDTGGLTMKKLTDGKTSTYSLPLKYSGSQKGSLSGTITFTGTIFVPTTIEDKIADTPTGGTVTFANKDGSMTEWIVYNKTGSEADLITKACVTQRVYHADKPYPGWPNSDIRKWLNDGTNGYKSKLSDEMKGAIKPQNLTTASAYNNWGTTQSSTDEIYLLTETGKDSGKVGKTIGASVTLTTEQLKSTGVWWLRSPRSNDFSCGYISTPGDVSWNDIRDGQMYSRPALTIRLY